jgi:hypothetical protein
MRYTFECNSGTLKGAAIAFEAYWLYFTLLAICCNAPSPPVLELLPYSWD